MKRDGAEVAVEVSDDLSRVSVAGTSYEVRLASDQNGKVELEIAEDPVTVGSWPAPCRRPIGLVEVNGEAWRAEVEVGPAVPGRRSPVPLAPPEALPARVPAVEGGPSGGVAVVPPMPGRVVELRVREGESVAKGAVLLVLEAMKMRNEVASPAAGVVRGLAVREGSNVRARETIMVIAPA